MKTKERGAVALTFRSAEAKRDKSADLRLGATNLKERTGSVYENKGRER
jgi:hypothetical protein